MDIKKHVPPFFYIPMPVDKDGNGPVEQQVAVKTFYEVWDQLFLTIASFEKEEDAQEFARLLNLQSPADTRKQLEESCGETEPA